MTIAKAPNIRQLRLQRLWHERETTLQSCIPDEQNDAPDQRGRRGCCSVPHATAPMRLA